MEYLRLFKALYEQKIRYLICGGMAINIYGIPRMTADIDLVVDFEIKNLRNIEKSLTGLGYKNLVPVPFSTLSDASVRKELFSGKNMVAYSFFGSDNTMMNIDILVHTSRSFDEYWNKRIEKTAGSYRIWLVSPDHLMEMKQDSGRKQDQDDILALKILLKNG